MKHTLLIALLALGTTCSCKKSSTPSPDPVPDPNAWAKDGLVAYYPFNGNLNDASGNGLNGAAMGAISYVADKSGATGKALHLNGDNGYVRVPDNVKLDLTQRMTVALQFRPETTTLYSLVGKSLVTGGTQSFHLMCNYTTAASFQVIKSGRCSSSNVVDDWSSVFADNAAYINLNTWNCIVAVFDGTSQKIYLNGSKVADMPISFGEMGGCSDTEMRFGYWWDGQTYTYKGSMDEIRIYNRALSADEVVKLCNLQ